MATRVLGKTAGTLDLPDRASIRAASALMAAQATRELRIFSRDLDPALYDHEDFLESVLRLALHSPRSTIEILLLDPAVPVRNGHRLLELSRQLPSRIQIRCIPAEFQYHPEAYLIADGKGYVLRPLAELFQGRTDFSAPLKVRHLRGQFEHIWERSTQSPDLITFGKGV